MANEINKSVIDISGSSLDDLPHDGNRKIRRQFGPNFEFQFDKLLIATYSDVVGILYTTVEQIVADYIIRKKKPGEVWKQMDLKLGFTYPKQTRFSYNHFMKRYVQKALKDNKAPQEVLNIVQMLTWEQELKQNKNVNRKQGK